MRRIRFLLVVIAIAGLLTANAGTALAAKAGGQLGGIQAAPSTISFGNVPSGTCLHLRECLASVYVKNTAPVGMRLSGLASPGDGFYFTGLFDYPDQCTTLQWLNAGATCVVFVGFCTTVICDGTAPIDAGRYTSQVGTTWTDGARVINVTVKLSAKVVST